MKRALLLICSIYALTALLHSLATPIMEAWDEPWHYPVSHYLANHGFQLPVQDAAADTPWRQQGNQPPLYYLMGAVLTASIDTSDMGTLRRMNPHAAMGLSQPDGNINLIVHRTVLESFPWRGTVLAVMVVRFFSIALGLGTVWVTHQLGRELFPERPLVALGAAALTAFLPMFVFISASVSNDNLSNLLGNALTLVSVRLVQSTSAPSVRTYVLLGTLTGAALLSKLSLGFFIPVIVMVLVVLSLRLRDWRPLVIGGAVSGGLTALIAGWWYVRNMQLYGDPTGLTTFLDIVGRRVPPANWPQIWSERFSFMRSYWGAYGSINIMLPDALYALFDLIGLAAFGSAALFLLIQALRRAWTPSRWLAVGVTLVWPVLTFISLIRWTTETYGSQGRLVFVALSSLSLWMTVGILAWLPAGGAARYRPQLQAMPLFAVSGLFLAVTGFAPLLVIAPAYALPPVLPTVSAHRIDSVFTDERAALGLIQAQMQTTEAQPGDWVHLLLDWQILSPADRDYSLFLHLLTPDGVILAQRDIYPGGGKLATSDLPTGYAWHNPMAVRLPPTAYTPMRLEARVGWYDLATGQRLRLADGRETVEIGTVRLVPRTGSGGIPNPLRINFDGQIALVGYELDTLSASPGGALILTLYWQALAPITRDYVVFANIIDPQTLTKYAASNAMPAGWTRPTSTWQVDEIVEDMHALTVAVDAAPGIYELEIGLYLQEGDFPRLRIVPEAGGVADTYVYLTRVRIREPQQP